MGGIRPTGLMSNGEHMPEFVSALTHTVCVCVCVFY